MAEHLELVDTDSENTPVARLTRLMDNLNQQSLVFDTNRFLDYIREDFEAHIQERSDALAPSTEAIFEISTPECHQAFDNALAIPVQRACLNKQVTLMQHRFDAARETVKQAVREFEHIDPNKDFEIDIDLRLVVPAKQDASDELDLQGELVATVQDIAKCGDRALWQRLVEHDIPDQISERLQIDQLEGEGSSSIRTFLADMAECLLEGAEAICDCLDLIARSRDSAQRIAQDDVYPPCIRFFAKQYLEVETRAQAGDENG